MMNQLAGDINEASSGSEYLKLLCVGLVQFNIEKHFEQKHTRKKVTDPDTGEHRYERTVSRIPATSIFPYSVGLLQAYAQEHCKHAERIDFAALIHRRISISEAVEELKCLDLVGFSNYVWNEQLNLKVAKILKKMDPDKIIVFGGPQVPNEGIEYLAEHEEIDLLCHGEGEVTFSRILDHFWDKNWAVIPSITYRTNASVTKRNPNNERVKKMDTIPSPYTKGVFDTLKQKYSDHSWVAPWETNRGCPFKCSFCDWGSATASRVYRFDEERIGNEVEWFGNQRVGTVICCDANFGIVNRDEKIAEAIVNSRKSKGFPFVFAIQNSKNATERTYRIQKMINEYMITIGVTLSLQTVNPKSLKAIARENISTQSYEDLQQRFSLDGTYTYTDVILSLPEEDYESFRDGVEVIIQNGQYNHIQFHNLSILPNAEMGNAAYQERYGMKVVPQRIVAIHDYIEDVSGEEVAEYLDVVVGTNTLLSNDWHKAKVFSWYMDFIFFDKISQVALLLLKRLLGIRVVDMVDAIMYADSETYPILHELNSLAFEHSRKIQDGGDEYIPSEEWMGVYWPVNQYLRLTLLDTAKLNRFYDEL
ncbi:MAG: radical SAM protein, partial [Nitrospinaceae bacterium]